MNRDRIEGNWQQAGRSGWRQSMKKQTRRLTFLLLAGWALGVHAQTVWTYEVIGPDNTAKVTLQPPMDISYPPANMRAQIYNPNERQGILLTAREEAARMNASKLIILLGSGK
jgi:hypothetical protein